MGEMIDAKKSGMLKETQWPQPSTTPKWGPALHRHFSHGGQSTSSVCWLVEENEVPHHQTPPNMFPVFLMQFFKFLRT
jgi:hypothetical protein